MKKPEYLIYESLLLYQQQSIKEKVIILGDAVKRIDTMQNWKVCISRTKFKQKIPTREGSEAWFTTACNKAMYEL